LRPEWKEKLNPAEVSKKVWEDITSEAPLLAGDDIGKLNRQSKSFREYQSSENALLQL